ncbi:unnamed protein product [Somion occarium]|uniref:Uncharacterized protein n=1 Tax=Somion occarium TaxID=3059160 RepID=A0ABP1E7Y6_9APHY
MSFSYAPDFVITRKRKRPRQAVDPCLGFYPSPEETSIPMQQIDETMALNVHVIDIKPRVIAVERVEVPGVEHQVTVEDFLRWSSRTPVKTYRQKKQHRVVDLRAPIKHAVTLSTDSDDSSTREMRPSKRRRMPRIIPDIVSDVVPTDQVKHNRIQKNTRQSYKRSRIDKNTQSLPTGLHASPGLIDVEPSEHTDDAHICTLRPLNLVPMSSSPSCSPKPKRWRLVDPRKTSLHSDTININMENESGVSPCTKQFRRLSLWSPPTPGFVSASPLVAQPALATNGRQSHRYKGAPTVKDRHGVAPLAFISLEEHERLLAERAPSLYNEPGDASDTINRSSSTQTRLTKSALTTSRVPKASSYSLSHSALSTVPPPVDPDCSTVITINVDPQIDAEVILEASTSLSAHKGHHVLPVSSSPLGQLPDPVSSLPPQPRPSLPATPVTFSSTDKHMKPFASFLDRFRETARIQETLASYSALPSHSQHDTSIPTERTLDDLNAFSSTLFSAAMSPIQPTILEHLSSRRQRPVIRRLWAPETL